MAANTPTVKFNVGGKMFEVLREPTLSLHPDSILNTMAQEHTGEEPIFVEANPDLFQYMLDFHRHRKIHIPATISKAAVLKDAHTLGLPVSDADVVLDSCPFAQISSVAADAMNQERALLQRSFKMNKAALLADMVIDGALKASPSSGNVVVTFNDLKGFGEDVVKYLANGTSSAMLQEALSKWADRVGYDVAVQGRPVHLWSHTSVSFTRK